MKVLVINCGSSSLKYQLIDSQSEEVLAKGLCERIGIEGSSVTHQKAGEGKKTEAVLMKDHTDAVKVVIEKLTDPAEGVIASLKEIDAVGHRIVHGGEKFKGSVVIDDSVLEAIAECNDLAPLHNPANLIGIRSCQKVMPGVPWWLYSIPHSIRRCPARLIYTVCRMNIMKNTKYVVTASMEPAMISFPNVSENCLEKTERI